VKRRASSDTNTSPIEKTNVYQWYPNSNDLKAAQNKTKLRSNHYDILWHTTSMQNILIPKGTKVTDSPEAFKKDHRSIQRHIFSCHTAKSFDLLHKLTSEDAK
jgi:hypothetical protein